MQRGRLVWRMETPPIVCPFRPTTILALHYRTAFWVLLHPSSYVCWMRSHTEERFAGSAAKNLKLEQQRHPRAATSRCCAVVVSKPFRQVWISVLLVVAITALLLLCKITTEDHALVCRSNDPYTLLGLDPWTTDPQTIRRAVRHLTLQLYPDEYQTVDPATERKLRMVQEAYNVLLGAGAATPLGPTTDHTTPSWNVSWLGLPKLLLEGDNQNLVVVTYLVLMVGVIPYCVWMFVFSLE